MAPIASAFSVDWFSHNIPFLTDVIPEWHKEQPVKYLEIGAFEGRSTIWFLDNYLIHPHSWILTIDTFKGSPEHSRAYLDGLEERFRANVAPYGEKVLVRKGRSADVLPNMEEAYFDLVYVDGSHDARDVIRDGIHGLRILNHGGILIFDDYLFRDLLHGLYPAVAIDAFLDIFHKDIEVLKIDCQVACKKR